MLPPPARETTSLSRIVATIVFAFVFPSVILSQVILWIDGGGAFDAWASTAAPAALTALPFGVMLGWPYVLCAAAPGLACTNSSDTIEVWPV
ncbi:hypothetical protein BH10PSE3_BH10PSE3_08270 [soil metagenome]